VHRAVLASLSDMTLLKTALTRHKRVIWARPRGARPLPWAQDQKFTIGGAVKFSGPLIVRRTAGGSIGLKVRSAMPALPPA
jgi:hypothetical protein